MPLKLLTMSRCWHWRISCMSMTVLVILNEYDNIIFGNYIIEHVVILWLSILFIKNLYWRWRNCDFVFHLSERNFIFLWRNVIKRKLSLLRLFFSTLFIRINIRVLFSLFRFSRALNNHLKETIFPHSSMYICTK